MPYKDPAKRREAERNRYYLNREQLLEGKRKYYIENREQIQAYRDANRDRMRASDRARYHANRDKQLERHRKYRSEHPDKCRESMQRWRLRNPKYTTKYYARFPGKCLAQYAKRRALKRSATVGSTSAIAKIYERAAELRQWFDVVVDHIIPIARGGVHAASNLQIIYRKDNLAKFCRLDYQPDIIFA